MVEGSTLEALRDDHASGLAHDGHPALFPDHGIVHVRDIAAGVVGLADTVGGGLLLPLPPSPPRGVVVGVALLLPYVHDVGMHDPTPTGRRVHALYAAHVPFSGEMDDVLDRLASDGGPVVGRIAAVDAAAPFGVARGVVLRELVALAVAHSKSAVPAILLAETTRLRTLMRRVVLTDLVRHRDAEALPTPDDAPLGEPGAHTRWYADPARDPYAWLGSPEAAHRAFAEDAIDAGRLVRAAEAPRQRGTQLRNAAGHKDFSAAGSGPGDT